MKSFLGFAMKALTPGLRSANAATLVAWLISKILLTFKAGSISRNAKKLRVWRNVDAAIDRAYSGQQFRNVSHTSVISSTRDTGAYPVTIQKHGVACRHRLAPEKRRL